MFQLRLSLNIIVEKQSTGLAEAKYIGSTNRMSTVRLGKVPHVEENLVFNTVKWHLLRFEAVITVTTNVAVIVAVPPALINIK